MMTEEEAKEKWCPSTRIVIGPNDAKWQGNGFTNRNFTVDCYDNGFCLADGCACWVWEEKNKKNDLGIYTTEEMPREQWLGRCGMVRV